jgi:hypothetical protein
VDDPFAPLYGSLNWRVPGTLRCRRCKDIAWPPTAGCYPSALEHYEAVLGALPKPRTRARILILFQDPRPGEDNFISVDPTVSPSDLTGDEHRYFCLSPHAWRALGLHERTGCSDPTWPSAETAPHFLRRYFQRRGTWSYDGFLAYFLDLFRPRSAAITDIAKCHFGDAHSRAVLERCAGIHLRSEAELIKPNLILSFTSQFDQRLLSVVGPRLAGVPVFRLHHPAAWSGREKRIARFVEQVAEHRAVLASLGVDVPALRKKWLRDAQLARASGDC